MTDQEFIKELIKKNLISDQMGSRILRDASLRGEKAEDMIYQSRLADEVSVAKVKSELLNIPWRKVEVSKVTPDLISLIPKDTSKTYKVIPIEKNGDMLVVGMLHPDDVPAQEALKFIAKKERLSLGVYIVTPSDLTAVWRKYTPYKNEIESAVEEMGNVKQADSLLVSLEDEGGTGDSAPVIKIVASTLREAVDEMASDIHVEPQKLRLRIRFRVDGDLKEMASLPIALSQPVVSRIKVLAKLKLDETRIPQDGRFRAVIAGRDIDFRVATFPTPSGEKVVLRVLDPTVGLKGLQELGLNNYNFGILEDALDSPYGMILITGPTGSGKTTTLYAVMQKVNSESVNIVTLEDPVEYFMEGINQSQVKPEIGYDFSSGLRQILRQDPDIIMVGEIRDSETANLAVNAALTGHLMLSTLHTNNSLGVVPRLIDLGVPGFLLASSLNLMLAQRLVGKLCPKCKKQKPVSGEVEKMIDEALKNLPEKAKAEGAKYKKPYSSWYAEPDPKCEVCNGRGVVGRIAVFEIFKMTRELSDIISRGFTEGALIDESVRQGMVTMRQDGILKSLEGEVMLEEVIRETE
ncbi:GspE/PulE family protein [Patescibacteria group bacterium]|nr:GspE/PulE family protein [Patescibacteria group bacterium]